MRLLSANVKGDVLIAVDNVTTGVVKKDPKLSADEVVVQGLLVESRLNRVSQRLKEPMS